MINKLLQVLATCPPARLIHCFQNGGAHLYPYILILWRPRGHRKSSSTVMFYINHRGNKIASDIDAVHKTSHNCLECTDSLWPPGRMMFSQWDQDIMLSNLCKLSHLSYPILGSFYFPLFPLFCSLKFNIIVETAIKIKFWGVKERVAQQKKCSFYGQEVKY